MINSSDVHETYVTYNTRRKRYVVTAHRLIHRINLLKTCYDLIYKIVTVMNL